MGEVVQCPEHCVLGFGQLQVRRDGDAIPKLLEGGFRAVFEPQRHLRLDKGRDELHQRNSHVVLVLAEERADPEVGLLAVKLAIVPNPVGPVLVG